MPEYIESLIFERDEIFNLLQKEIKELNGSDLVGFEFDEEHKTIACKVKDTKIKQK